MSNVSNFVEGLPIFFIGVLVVFAMLFLLIGFMLVLGAVMDNTTKKAEEKKAAEKAIQEAAKITSEEQAATVEENAADELELVAVITAAIAASLGTTSDRLQVRSLRKVQRKSL